MVKALLTTALLIAATGSMSICAAADETEEAREVLRETELVEAAADVNGDGKIVVGYIAKSFNDHFHSRINEYAKTALDQMVGDGIIDEWSGTLDGNTDAQIQIDHANECIENGCDFVIILPREEEASDPAVTSMAEAGINVIVVNSATVSTDDVALTYCGSDDVYAGELLGQWVVDNCPDGGKYIHCNGVLGNSAQIKRTKGIHNILDQHKEFELAGDEDTQWNGLLAAAAAENYIGIYGSELKAVVCDNDDMSSSAQDACNNMGRSDIICIGVDGNSKALEMIRDGQLKGTILQDGIGQMTAAFDTITQVIKEGKAPKNVMVPFITVTQDNVGDYLPK